MVAVLSFVPPRHDLMDSTLDVQVDAGQPGVAVEIVKKKTARLVDSKERLKRIQQCGLTA